MTVDVVYKLTDGRGQTFGGTQWGPGVERSVPGDGPLCTGAWVHAYRDPLLAVLLSPAHVQFTNPRLWRCEAVVWIDDGAKVGCKWLKVIEEIPLPEIAPLRRVRFAILCAKQVCTDPTWLRCADDWLSGLNGTEGIDMKKEGALPLAARCATAATWWPYQKDQTLLRYYVAFAALRALEEDPSIDLVTLAHEAVATDERLDRSEAGA